MNILLTGGTGYIGTKLCLKLLELGHTVDVVDTSWFGNFLPAHKNLIIHNFDLRDIEKLPNKSFDVIMHLAAISNDPCVELNPKLSWEVNALATMRLTDWAARRNTKQFIFASSGSVYGVKSEERVTEDLTLEPISEYNKTKMVGERIVLSYKDKMQVHCLRPATVCGLSPRQRLDLSVNILTTQAATKGFITVLGGSQVRPNIHIDDMIGVYLHFLNNPSLPSDTYNAGFENKSIMDIANLIKNHIPCEVKVSESNDPRSYRLDSSKLLATGYKPQKTIQHAIEELSSAIKKGLLVPEEKNNNIAWMKHLKVG